MTQSEYSYLDLTVMPFLRKRVISNEAAILFDKQFGNVLWANAIGAELFGGNGLIDLLDAEISQGHPLVRQIKNASIQIENNAPIIRGFRITRGLKTEFIHGEVSALKLPNGEEVVLLACEALNHNQSHKEHELAQLAVNTLNGFADAAGIIDEYGLIVASTSQFDRLGIDAETLETFVDIVANEDDRLVKRAVQTLSGKTVAAGLGRIRDNPGRFLIVLAEADGFISDDAEADMTQQDELPAAPIAQDLPPWIGDNEPDLSPDKALDANRQKPTEEKNTETDQWYFADDQNQAETNIIQQDPQEDNNNEPVNEPAALSPSRTKRFAFTIDNQQIIRSTSGELIEAVGKHSGDITNQHWKDVASARNFDENEDILKLLEEADTWSGKTVLWPIDNTDMVVPIDLAALPAFDRDKNFDGFRGFGIIREDDTIVDPEATGQKIADLSAIASDVNSENELEKIKADDISSLAWQTDISQEDRENENNITRNNVVQLSSRQSNNDDNIDHLPESAERLNGKEERAFSEINKSLSAIENSEQKEFTNSQNADPDQTIGEQIPPANDEDELSTINSLSQTTPLLIYQTAKTLFANSALLEKTGYTSTEELADCGGIDALFDDRDEALDGMHIISKEGASIPVNCKLTSINWNAEKALCITFENRDDAIIDPKSALDMIRVSELENILETAADGILVIDQSNSIDSLNSAGEALFGKNHSDVVGNSFYSLFATESHAALKSYLADIDTPGLSGILNQGREVIGLEANGGMIPLFVTLGKIGTSSKTCAVLRDLTDWKRGEEDLVQAKRSAETASEQKSEFLSRVSHEIRDPLTAIIGFSDIMIEERFGKIENPKYQDYLKDINRSGVHVLDLVNDLLDISKIEAGKMEMSYEAVDLNQLAGETVALLQPQANAKRIIIRTSLSRAVPKVVADTRSIRQIILNLVSNAIKHSPKNSQVIVSTVYEENGEVGLRIRDTGNGMSSEDLKDAMEPFSQVGLDKAGSGSGLGLPLTKALVTANRAFFELESTLDEGTVAHIQFPSQRVLAD